MLEGFVPLPGYFRPEQTIGEPRLQTRAHHRYTSVRVACPWRSCSLYTPNPRSLYRVKFDFRVDFTNGGHVQGENFLLDIEGDDIDDATLKEMIVDAMNLARAETVTLFKKQIVRRGEHADAA